MKSHKEWVTERLDDLALEYHGKFYYDLPSDLQQTIFAIAQREYVDYLSSYIDNTFDRMINEKH